MTGLPGYQLLMPTDLRRISFGPNKKMTAPIQCALLRDTSLRNNWKCSMQRSSKQVHESKSNQAFLQHVAFTNECAFPRTMIVTDSYHWYQLFTYVQFISGCNSSNKPFQLVHFSSHKVGKLFNIVQHSLVSCLAQLFSDMCWNMQLTRSWNSASLSSVVMINLTKVSKPWSTGETPIGAAELLNSRSRDASLFRRNPTVQTVPSKRLENPGRSWKYGICQICRSLVRSIHALWPWCQSRPIASGRSKKHGLPVSVGSTLSFPGGSDRMEQPVQHTSTTFLRPEYVIISLQTHISLFLFDSLATLCITFTTFETCGVVITFLAACTGLDAANQNA